MAKSSKPTKNAMRFFEECSVFSLFSSFLVFYVRGTVLAITLSCIAI